MVMAFIFLFLVDLPCVDYFAICCYAKRYEIQREYNNSVRCACSTTIDVPVHHTSTSNNDQQLSIDPQSAKEKWRPAFLRYLRNEEPGF
jgi:hypothetical protein